MDQHTNTLIHMERTTLSIGIFAGLCLILQIVGIYLLPFLSVLGNSGLEKVLHIQPIR